MRSLNMVNAKHYGLKGSSMHRRFPRAGASRKRCVTYDGDLSVIHVWFDTFVDLQRGGACGGAPV